MLCRRLLVTVVFCLFFTITLSIRCYTGTDRQCILVSNTNGCVQGAICQCAKYRFQCTSDDQACTKQEQSTGARKWAYTFLPQSTCQLMQNSSSSVTDVACCSKNGCNRPEYGRCSKFQARRRALRKLTDLLDFE